MSWGEAAAADDRVIPACPAPRRPTRAYRPGGRDTRSNESFWIIFSSLTGQSQLIADRGAGAPGTRPGAPAFSPQPPARYLGVPGPRARRPGHVLW